MSILKNVVFHWVSSKLRKIHGLHICDSKKVGEELEGEVRNITEFGLFVALNDEIDGMVHISDISWEDQSEDVLKTFTVGDKVKTKILEMDADKERVGLGIKQLTEDPFKGAMDGVAKGAVVTCTVQKLKAAVLK